MDGPTYNPVALTVDANRPNIRLSTLEPIGNGITTNYIQYQVGMSTTEMLLYILFQRLV